MVKIDTVWPPRDFWSIFAILLLPSFYIFLLPFFITHERVKTKNFHHNELFLWKWLTKHVMYFYTSSLTIGSSSFHLFCVNSRSFKKKLYTWLAVEIIRCSYKQLKKLTGLKSIKTKQLAKQPLCPEDRSFVFVETCPLSHLKGEIPCINIIFEEHMFEWGHFWKKYNNYVNNFEFRMIKTTKQLQAEPEK